MAADKWKVGLYGHNGHQIHAHLNDHPEAEIAAIAGFGDETLAAGLAAAGAAVYGSLEEMLADPAIEMISLCSPIRAEQAAHAVLCLEAGKHVYAEKPAATTEADLERIIAAVRRTGRRFHEMSASTFQQPYAEMAKLVRQGVIGEVVQVFSQKSYPYGTGRPQREAVDGGLLLQAGVYNVRFIEQIAGVRVIDMDVAETKLGNGDPAGECRRAVSMTMKLANGGVGSGIANYLSPGPAVMGRWGYEIVRIFGTKGFVECFDVGRSTRLVADEQDCGTIVPSEPSRHDVDVFIEHLRHGTPMPFSIEEELNPVRMLIRAKHKTGVDAPLPHL
ncbi:Gfo/Idh/MocA family protein [Paenibacillus cymbidii]|uniref:Gfo/Idh/MocA family protein n=1 Tax=Paenibacillus cymbidii TaxID=1639034 RepID=UPI0010807720|nr:Gfo/Idh/MocA family oxidoreductase [Paenibacillus cymbidii]